jgi:hypothetical protein
MPRAYCSTTEYLWKARNRRERERERVQERERGRRERESYLIHQLHPAAAEQLFVKQKKAYFLIWNINWMGSLSLFPFCPYGSSSSPPRPQCSEPTNWQD